MHFDYNDHKKNFQAKQKEFKNSYKNKNENFFARKQYMVRTMKDFTMLPTAEISLMSSEGEFKIFRALIDTGSASSLISNKAVDELKYDKVQFKTKLYAIYNVEVAESDSLVLASVKTRGKNCFYIKATVIDDITEADDFNINTRKFKKKILFKFSRSKLLLRRKD